MDLERDFDTALQTLVEEDVGGVRFLLGVSGGIDSMCMAELFRRSSLRPSFALAHVNFSLRGTESDGDMESVLEWGRTHGVKVYCRTFDTRTYAASHSISTQMAARDLRYGFFKELMEEEGFDYLCVAHNLDDSVETVFLNMVRGTGLKGLSGIPVKNGRIIRPLLGVSRERISEYVADNSIDYRDDRTNFESHYARNRVRNIIFPEFRKLNPSFLETLSREMDLFRQASAIIDDMYPRIREQVCVEHPSAAGAILEIRSAELLSLPQPGYWLYSFLKDYGFNGTQVSDMEKALLSDRSVGRLFYSATHRLVLGSGSMRVYPLDADSGEDVLISGQGTYRYGNAELSVEFFPRERGFDPRSDGSVLYFAADTLQLPMVCRAWRDADRFRPFGMKWGFKKLGDFFTDIKLDRVLRQQQPVLADAQGRVVCLPGLRTDERFRIVASTRLICAVRIDYSK